MKGRRLWLFLLGCSGAVLIWATRDDSPSYNGRSLAAWLKVYGEHEPQSVKSLESAEAIRLIGTNAVPWLVKWIPSEYEGSIWFRLRTTVIQKSPSDSRAAQFLERLLTPRSAIKAKYAIDGFAILGSQGSVAVPQLTRFIQDTNSPETANRSKMLLASIGAEGLPALLTVVTNPTGFQREVAFASLEMFMSATNLIPAVPALTRCLSESNTLAAFEAEWILRKIAQEPRTAFIILTNINFGSNRNLRVSALDGIRRAKTINRSALPILVEVAAHDPDPGVRGLATEALRRGNLNSLDSPVMDGAGK